MWEAYTAARHKWLCVQHESLDRQYSVKQRLFPHTKEISYLVGLHSAVRDGLAHELGTILEKNWSMYWPLHLFARGDWKCTFYFRVKKQIISYLVRVRSDCALVTAVLLSLEASFHTVFSPAYLRGSGPLPLRIHNWFYFDVETMALMWTQAPPKICIPPTPSK